MSDPQTTSPRALSVACPNCNVAIGEWCQDLGFGSVALGADGFHPDRPLLAAALDAKPEVWEPSLIVECPTCGAVKTKPCFDPASGARLTSAHTSRLNAYSAACARLPPIDSAVDHPRHYNASPSGVECIDVVEHMTFNVGNAVKYAWRAGLKGGDGSRIEDLKKAAWYLNREIERLSKEKA